MTERPPLQLLQLPTEVLTEIYAFFASGVIAEVVVPARKCLSPLPVWTIAWSLTPHRNNRHHHRFVLKDENGSEVLLGLLGVSKQVRADAIRFFAANIPLTLKINSYAPSLHIAPNLICPRGWTENVRDLTVSRYIGSTASIGDLLSRFPNLKTATIRFHETRMAQNGPRHMYHAMFQENLATFREWVQTGIFAKGLVNDLTVCFHESMKSLCPVQDRTYRVRVEVRYCWFSTEKYNHVNHVSRHSIMVGSALENESSEVDVQFESTKEVQELFSQEVPPIFVRLWC